MKDKLKIERHLHLKRVVLSLDGRIDAYWSAILDEAISNEIRSGHYRISLDLLLVDYLSSAGIRVLVKCYKEMKAINGDFSLINLTPEVKKIIGLVGMDMLIGKPESDDNDPTTNVKNEITLDNTIYIVENLKPKNRCTINLYGNPGDFYSDAGDIMLTKKTLARAEYGLGLGAISPDTEDAKNRLGEFIALGEALAYLPSDNSHEPDYTLKSGKLIPEIQCFYGLFFSDAFNNLIHFDQHKINATTNFSDLITALAHITGYKTFAAVIIAETAGLVGVSVSNPPLKNKSKNIFSFPEVKENVHFTVEAEHARQLAVISGIFTTGNNKSLLSFCRPIRQDSEISGHAHAAVFSFHQLKKTEQNLAETIRNCFENEHLIDILHLLNDDREIIGIGESRFLNGMCWVGKVE